MTTGVLVMAYGTPTSREDILRFSTEIRGGREPMKAELAALVARYDAIGGVSPLNARTLSQLRALQGALDAIDPGKYLAVFGAKHAPPRIEEAIDELATLGIGEIVGLVLAPHYSSMSVGEYLARATEHARLVGLDTRSITRWGDDPVLIELLAARVKAARRELEVGGAKAISVVFSAHSLPARIEADGDPYVTEVTATAQLIVAKLKLSNFAIAWQSAPRATEPWLQPTLAETLDELAQNGSDAVVVCPIGFTSDHLEILYDLDIEAAARAKELQMPFRRTPSLNDDAMLFAGLARRVIACATGSRR